MDLGFKMSLNYANRMYVSGENTPQNHLQDNNFKTFFI